MPQPIFSHWEKELPRTIHALPSWKLLVRTRLSADGGQPVSRLAGITRPSAFISEKSNSYYLRSFSSPLPSCSKPTCFSPWLSIYSPKPHLALFCTQPYSLLASLPRAPLTSKSLEYLMCPSLRALPLSSRGLWGWPPAVSWLTSTNLRSLSPAQASLAWIKGFTLRGGPGIPPSSSASTSSWLEMTTDHRVCI